MGLLSYFKSQTKPATDRPAEPPDAVAAARSRARRRLIGAVLLLAVGVIGFPLLFETQPRPIAVDVPIVMPDRGNAPPLVLSRAPAAASTPPMAASDTVPRATAPSPSPAPATAVTTERAGDQGRDVTPPAPGATATAASPAPAAPAKPPTSASVDKPATAAVPDGARAKALLEGQSPADAPSARSVVQVGAFNDAEKIRQVRAQVEKLGLKTYTQAVTVGGAQSTRVRVGPFATRAEADKAASRIKAAGLPAAVLTL